MKTNSLLLAITFFMIACSKEARYTELNLKHGDEVELLVDHRFGAINEQLLTFPDKKTSPLDLHGFEERIPGYSYRVKAKMFVEKEPPQDGSAYYLKFEKVISSEKYTGTEPFEISLIRSIVPGGQQFGFKKKMMRTCL